MMSKRLARVAVGLAMAGCLTGYGATGLQNRGSGNAHTESTMTGATGIARNALLMVEPRMPERKIHEETPTEPKKRNMLAELFIELSIEVRKLRDEIEQY
ncbi:hypothetical protein KKF81_06090 [Candidatus Micrarchaeota archaeon]|nr:hypothetical protein [Candidatus Micrarchaeota archaeon]MBU1166499.1 hypothetical protein [Candidatus Micrarchaeota archaeon]MBU1887214.1 hypothetical protein [Candidatus Micrarchaeota archaeon]